MYLAVDPYLWLPMLLKMKSIDFLFFERRTRMFFNRFRLGTSIVVVSSLLTACASHPVNTKIGDVKVLYTLFYPDGSRLKEFPTEVTVVKRESTIKNVAAQVGLNVLALALGGGGFGFQGFSKDDLKGTPIEDAVSRENLKNPVLNEFLRELQSKVSTAVQQNPALVQKSYQQPILIADGNARLIYESLAGEDEEYFRLKSNLIIYKRREDAGILTFSPNIVMNCETASDNPLTLSQWAVNNYQMVKTQLDTMLSTCEPKILAKLPDLLKD